MRQLLSSKTARSVGGKLLKKMTSSLSTKWALYSVALAILALASGCMNMPTPPNQITGIYVSPLKYKDYTREQLATELDSLARRENDLVTAQIARYKSSEMQAFWWGFGQGDSTQASELAEVRGEREAVVREMEARGYAIPPEPPVPDMPISHPAPSSGHH